VVLPELSPRWSAVRIAEEFAKAPLRCRDCRSGGLPGSSEVSRLVLGDGLVASAATAPRVELDVARSLGITAPGAAAVTAYLGALSPNSRRGMSDALTLLARMLGHETPSAVAWGRLTYADTSALQAKLIASGRNPDGCKKIIGGLRGVLKASKRLGLMTGEQYDRATELERIRGSRLRNVKNLRVGDLESLLEATRDDEKPMRSLRDRALLALLAGGGLRRAEAASVTTASYNRATRTLLVRGKGDKDRLVPLPQWAAKALVEFVDARGFGGPLLCPVSQRDEAECRPLSGGQAVYVVLHRLVDRAGLTQWTPPHGYRRAFGTGLLRNGTDVFLVSKILGHSNPATTSKSYDVRGIDDFAAAVDRMPDPEVRA
jgi:site-specific recombinase XerD